VSGENHSDAIKPSLGHASSAVLSWTVTLIVVDVSAMSRSICTFRNVA
jgi:hypothetical protein